MTTFAKDIQELMTGWNTIMSAAKQQNPTVSEDELFTIASSAMNFALKLKA